MHPRIILFVAPLLASFALASSSASSATAGGSPSRPVAASDEAWLAQRWAGTDLAALAAAMRQWKAEKGGWPDDCSQSGPAYLTPAPRTDPWGSPYGCEVGAGRARVFSVGPDGRSGTSDDIVLDAESAQALAAALPAAPSAAPAPPPASAQAQATGDALQALAAGLASYRQANGRYPVADKAEHLERWLVPQHLAPAAWTAQDAWGRALRYRTTDVGSSYSLVSSGADGRWEALGPGASSAAGDADADIAVVDGRFVRWPLGLAFSDASAPAPAASVAGPAASAPAPAEPAEPQDPAERTHRRLAILAELLAKQRRDGRFIESDDAERLVRELNASAPAVDGWGRAISYLSADGGRHFALASPGPDGRLARDMQAYARGAAPAGDDVVARDGQLVAAR